MSDAAQTGLWLTLTFTLDAPDGYAAAAEALAAATRQMAGFERVTRVADGDTGGPFDDEWFLIAVRDTTVKSWQASSAEHDPDVAVECWHEDDKLELIVRLWDDAARRYGPRLLEDAWRWIGAVPGTLSPSSGLRPIAHPPLQPARDPGRPRLPLLQFENAASFFDRRFAAKVASAESRALLEHLRTTPAEGGLRFERGDVTLVAHAHELTFDDVVEAQGTHARWLVDAARQALPRLADRMLPLRGDQLEAPPLSFVDSESRVGFKTVVVFPDGTKEEEAWRDAVGVAKANHGKSGDEALAGVYVVVPLREHAVALQAEAEASGITGVCYPDDRGNLLVVTR